MKYRFEILRPLEKRKFVVLKKEEGFWERVFSFLGLKKKGKGKERKRKEKREAKKI